MPIPAEDRPLPQSPATTRRVEYSTCYMCACRCGIQVTLENDELRFIQGTRDHPVNQGVLCAKGSAGIMKQRSPAKLRKPLRRKAGALRGRGDFAKADAVRLIGALAMPALLFGVLVETDAPPWPVFTILGDDGVDAGKRCGQVHGRQRLQGPERLQGLGQFLQGPERLQGHRLLDGWRKGVRRQGRQVRQGLIGGSSAREGPALPGPRCFDPATEINSAPRVTNARPIP